MDSLHPLQVYYLRSLFFFSFLNVYYICLHKQIFLRTKRFDSLLKVALLLALPALFAIWVSLGIASSVLIGLGYGFLNPWISAFEAFRHEEATECQKLFHCVAVNNNLFHLSFRLSTTYFHVSM